MARALNGGGHLAKHARNRESSGSFLGDVEWGELDVLLVDVPPGTDKIRRLLELVPDLDQMLLVTTPSETSRFVVSKSVRMAREASVGTVALVANMVGPYVYRVRPCVRALHG